MTDRFRSIILVLFSVIVLAVPNAMIYQKERVLREGTVMFLELAPVDPRSLMQGDYMRLRYKIARDAALSGPADGKLVVTLDPKGVAAFARLHDPLLPLAPNEHLLRYRIRSKEIRLGAESFFFQEGHARYYANAKYGELRVADSGNSVLVGLRGQNLELLGPPRQ